MGNRPSVCSSCGKRLSKKSWYYRNGQYFCKKSCWKTAAEKARAEKKERPAQATQEQGTADTKPQAAEASETADQSAATAKPSTS